MTREVPHDVVAEKFLDGAFSFGEFWAINTVKDSKGKRENNYVPPNGNPNLDSNSRTIIRDT